VDKLFGIKLAYGSINKKGNLKTISKFKKIGVNTISIIPGNVLSSLGLSYSPYPSIWVGPGKYKFQFLDKQIADIVNVNPEANLICNIDLNTPEWWPRWLGYAYTRDNSFTKLGSIAASNEWRKETGLYLQNFLRYTESKYRKNIIAYVLTCGMTLEWQDFNKGEESLSRRELWRKWMKKQGFSDPIDIPPYSVREHISYDIFRDPVKDYISINYWKFNSWLIGDTILYFARKTQEIIKHRVPLGVFYGYVMEHGKERLLYEGHLDFDRVISSHNLDFFIAPGTYYDRQIGGASGFMTCIDSIRHHKKGFLQEIDHRTHTSRGVLFGSPIPGHESGFSNVKETIAGLRREFALALIKGASLWWCDLFGHWYDDERVVNEIGRMKKIWDKFTGYINKSVSEIAILIDAESMFYIDFHSDICNEIIYKQRYGLGRIGAPYDVFSFADLNTLNLSQYKLILLPNLFVVDDKKRELLEKKVCTDRKTVIWVYAPGIINNGKYIPSNVEKTTGISLNIKELTTKNMGRWISVFSPTPNLSADILRKLAISAGVHIYSETEEPLYANSHLISLHTKVGGKRKFKLRKKYKRIIELFSSKVVAEDTSEFEDNLNAPSTVLYELEEFK